MAVLNVELRCVACAIPRKFEQPPCQDGHDGDCAEWICTRCGEALLVAPFTPVRLRRRQQVAARRAA
jgi:hypothetical protein